MKAWLILPRKLSKAFRSPETWQFSKKQEKQWSFCFSSIGVLSDLLSNRFQRGLRRNSENNMKA